MEFSYAIKRGKAYPIIPITLSHGEFEIRTEALIDSGAVISTFQGELAELLGFELALLLTPASYLPINHLPFQINLLGQNFPAW